MTARYGSVLPIRVKLALGHPNEPRAELEPATKSLENDLFPFKAPGARGAGGLHRSAAIKEQLDVTCARG
jgi:hypothetical protein